MLSSRRSLLSTAIVPRLRLAFLTITFALVSAMGIGFFQLQSLKSSVDELTVSSVSVFVQTEETERRLKNLLLLLRRVDGVSFLDELGPLEQSVLQEITRIRTDTEGLSGAGQTNQIRQNMTRALDEIEAGAYKILDAKETFLVHQENLSQLVLDTETSRDVARSLLEDLSYEVAAATDQEFEVRRNESEIEFAQVEQLYHRNLISANALTEIALGLEAVIDGAIGLRSAGTQQDLKQVVGALRFRIRNIVSLSGQLFEGAARTELANEIGRIRELVFGGAGIASEVAQLLAQEVALEQFSSSQLGPIEDISALSSRLTRAARENLDRATIELDRTTRKMIAILTIAILLSLATIAATMIFVVETQINKRMARLTAAVLAIASGRTDYKVDVSGPDELGSMAAALEVFKLNAEELHRSNKELEKFAYVAAHDLRSPLRAIQDLIEWTLEDEDNVFSEDGRYHMGLLQSRIDRLNKLLSDLLEYSRAGKEADDMTQVSMKSIVADTAEMLDPNGHFNINHLGPCDQATTFSTPLRQILLNLVNNAIKHHDRDKGIITVEAHLDGGRMRCVVEDDGPGIPQEYHDRIFGLFQTLRPRDEVEGSGLGLAIIAKLLEHYGGSIQVQSDPELTRGTKFIFDMPETSDFGKTYKQAA